jgi:hypothetical protein
MIVRSQRARVLGDAIVSPLDFQSGGYGASPSDPGAGIIFDPSAVLDTPPVSTEPVTRYNVPADALPGVQAAIQNYVSPWGPTDGAVHANVPTLTPGQWIAIGGVALLLVLLIAKK